MLHRLSVAFGVALCVCSLPAGAQQSDEAKARAAQQRPYQIVRDNLREQINENALFLMGGPPGEAHIAYASDIAIAVNDGANMRVLPVTSADTLQNIKDILLLRGVDLGLTDVASLNLLRRTREAGPNIEKQLAYISMLYPVAVHVLARSDINALEDLAGKRVNLDVMGTGSARYITELLNSRGISVQPVYMTQLDAVEKMRIGELDATICVCAKPSKTFLDLRAEWGKPAWGMKFISVPYSASLQGDFFPAQLTEGDYPGMIGSSGPVETIATTAVLITFNWPKQSSRYNRTARFVDAFFSKFPALLKPPRQSGWLSVNLAASLPGWQRYEPAQNWLDKNTGQQAATMKADFEKFAEDQTYQSQSDISADKERLFQEFLEWMSKRSN